MAGTLRSALHSQRSRLILSAWLALSTYNAAAVYVADLRPLNGSVTGQNVSGEARFTIAGDNLTINIDMRGAPPSVEH